MSNNLSEDAEVKQLFVDESLEALQRVEQLLLEAEQGTARADMVDVMFRDMHTIKGTAGLLGYEKSTALAHAAEDLMSRLRDKSMKSRKAHFSLMVEVVDGLRQYVESVRDQNTEGERDCAKVVAELRRYFEAGDDAPDEVAAAAPPPPAPTVPAPVASTPAPAPAALAAPAPTALKAPSDVASIVEAAPEHHEEKGNANRHQQESDGTVRVNVAVLDKLMNLMGELVLSRNQMVQLLRSQRDAVAQAAAQRLSIVTSDLQEQIMKTRMQPVARVFEKIPRQVRDLAQQTGKRVAVEIEGTSTELDKALVEAIRDPVMHIIRNAIDHGIELPADRQAKGKSATGKLVVRAVHEGSTVSIEVRDDGRGIDPTVVKRIAVTRGVITQAEADRLSDREAAELVFRPGFSTAEKVTNISGRGVGMDVVRTHVERAGGQVELESQLGRGTTIRMKMPLTLAIIPALLVKDGGQRFAIPQANLLELVHLSEEQARTQIELVRGAPIFRLRGEILPVVRLAPLLRRQATEGGPINLVVVSIGLRRYGLAVEAIHDTEEIVIKPLHSMLKRLPCYAGATVLGDGGVALILDLGGVAAMAGIDLNSRSDRQDKAAEQKSSNAQSMLIFQAGENTRCAVPVSMVARLEQVEAKALEQLAGNEVLQYRGEIMPIIRPESMMSIGTPPPNDTGVQQLLVFNFGRPVGVAVNAILDATQVEVVHASDIPHTLGKTVVGGRTTLLVDIFSLVRQAAPACLTETSAKPRVPRVLLADELDSMRASLAGFLRASGIDVVEVAADATLREVRQQQRTFDAVIAGLEPVSRGLELVRAIKTEQPDLPVVCVARDDLSAQAEAVGARACIKRVEREALLEALTGAGIFHTTTQGAA